MRTNTINNLFMMVEGKKHKGQQKTEGLEESAFSELLCQLTAGDKQPLPNETLLTMLESPFAKSLEQKSITAVQDQEGIVRTFVQTQFTNEPNDRTGDEIQIHGDLHMIPQKFASTETRSDSSLLNNGSNDQLGDKNHVSNDPIPQNLASTKAGSYFSKAKLDFKNNTPVNDLQGESSNLNQGKKNTGEIVSFYRSSNESSGQLGAEVQIPDSPDRLPQNAANYETKALNSIGNPTEIKPLLFHQAIDYRVSTAYNGQLEKEAKIPKDMIHAPINFKGSPQIPVVPEIVSSDSQQGDQVIKKTVDLEFASIIKKSHDSEEVATHKDSNNLKGLYDQEPSSPKELTNPKEITNPKETAYVARVSLNSEFSVFNNDIKAKESSDFGKLITNKSSSFEQEPLNQDSGENVSAGPKVWEEQPQQAVKSSTNPNLNNLQNKVNDQIIKNFSLMQKNGLSQVNVDLKPEFLGEVSISLTFERGKVTAKIEVAKEEVKKLLEGQVSQLRSTLNELNIKVEDFKIEQTDKETSSRYNLKEGLSNDDRGNRGNQDSKGKREYTGFNHDSFGSEDMEIAVAPASRFANNEVNYMV